MLAIEIGNRFGEHGKRISISKWSKEGGQKPSAKFAELQSFAGSNPATISLGVRNILTTIDQGLGI